MSSATDLRKLRTEQLLHDALIQLMQEKNVYTITVKELTARAQINRITFYSHYEDIYDFLRKKIVELVSGLVPKDAWTNDSDFLFKPGNAFKHYLLFFQYVESHKDSFSAFLGKNGSPEFRQEIIRQGSERYHQMLSCYEEIYADSVSRDILVQYIISSHIGLVEYWLQSDTKYSSEYMARQLVTLTFSGPIKHLKLLQ